MPSKPSLSQLSLSASLLCLYVISGFSTLTLETVWMREISLRAGNTVVASTLVITVFFVAAAMGNLWGSRRVDQSLRPLLFYGRFEVASGLASVVTFAVSQWIWRYPELWPSGLSGQIPTTLLLVGPPSFLAGVAFPSLAETFVPNPESRTANAGPFYGMNLLGAAVGVAAGGVILPWWFGVKIAFAVASSLQIIGGLIAWRVALRGLPRVEAVVLLKQSVVKTSLSQPFPLALGWTLLAGSGLLSLATQTLLIVWARQILQGSVFAIAAVLAVFIGGLGLGAMIAARMRKKGRSPAECLVLFAGLSALLLFLVPIAGQWLVNSKFLLIHQSPIGMLREALFWSAVWLLPLTLCLGGIFPVAWELVQGDVSHEGRVLGLAMMFNKLGAAAGSIAGLFFLLPLFGLVSGTLMVGWGYLLFAIIIIAYLGEKRTPQWGGFLVAIVGLGFWQTVKPRSILGLTPDYRPVASYSSAYGPVAVIEKKESGSRQILLNSREYLSGTRHALASQRHESWVPLLFCRKPERVMTIGMAAGISAAAALDFPIKELFSVELVPEVVRAAHENFALWNSKLFSDPRSKIVIGDGRIILSQIPGQFDAIICDLLFPSDDGTANLYSFEFFQNVRSRLNSNGVFCLWLPCYQHDAQTAGIVIRTFQDVFPKAIVVRSNLDPKQPVIGLLGSNEPIPVSYKFLTVQLDSPTGRVIAQESPFFRSPENAALLIAGDLHAADPNFSDCKRTTDDQPILTFLGPRSPTPPLLGISFLNWIGKRFLHPLYPSCDIETPANLLASTRAANFYFAAATYQTVIPGDTRSEEARFHQVQNAFNKAHSLSPGASFPQEALGQ